MSETPTLPVSAGPTFSVPLHRLQTALTALSVVPYARPAVPVLGGVVVDAGDHGVRLSVFDFEVAVTVLLDDVTVKEAGRILLDRADLARIVKGTTRGEARKTLTDWEATFTGRDQHTAELALGGFEMPITCLALDDYPALPAPTEPTFTVDRDLLVAQLARIQVAIGRDANLPVSAELSASRLTLAATDRFHLSVVNLAVTPAGPLTEVDALLPGAELIRIVGALPPGPITVGLPAGDAPGRATLAGGAVEATVQLRDDKFPRWRQLVPPSFNTVVTVDRTALTRLVGKASALGNQPGRRIGLVVIRVEAGSLTVVPWVDDQARVRGATMPAEVDGTADVEVGFSGQRLLDALTAFRGDRVVLGVQERASRPVLIAETVDQLTDGGAAHRHLLMPANLGSAT